MITREHLLRFFGEMALVNEDTSLDDDFAAMGISEDFYDPALKMMLAAFLQDVRTMGQPKLAAATLFVAAFQLGYKAALELEMQRMASNDEDGA